MVIGFSYWWIIGKVGWGVVVFKLGLCLVLMMFLLMLLLLIMLYLCD